MILPALAAVLISVLPVAAQPARRDIVVLTSFPASFYEPFRQRFEAREPEFRLRMMNRKTGAAITLLRDPVGAQPDVFWSSSPDVFEILRSEGRLAPVSASAVRDVSHIAGFPIDGAGGAYRGFALSGFGIMWNEPRLRQAGVPLPTSLEALQNPAYRGLIAMSAPSRSGTTHLMVESVLQRAGWEKGWALWLRIAGNLATITARSYSVTAGVQQGRFGVGLSIDFLGRSGGKGDIGFGYPVETDFLPASIARLVGSAEPEGAERFIRFVLSPEGQALLRLPQVRRQPVNSEHEEPGATSILHIAEARRSGFVFDAALSGARYELVNILFDELITDRLPRRQALWQDVRRLQEAGSFRQDELEAIMVRLAEIPAGIRSGLLPDDMAPLVRVPRGVPLPPHQSAFVEQLRQDIEANLTECERLLESMKATLDARLGRHGADAQ